MAAAASDLLQEVGLATATTLDSNYTINDSTLTVASTSGMPTATGITVAIDIIDSNGEQVAGTYNEYVGTVASSTSISSVDWANGSGDRNYSAGATTRVYIPVSAERENRIVEWGLTHADQDGTLKAGAVDNAAVIADGIITPAKFTTATNPTTHLDETTFDFVASGCVWSGDAYASTRNASMTAGVVYINGERVPIALVTARSFTASRDTYIDVGTDGVLDYTEVTNNNASPALAANHMRIGIIVTGASNIAAVGSVNQGEESKVLPIASSVAYAVTDSLGNLICPRDPNRKLLGYRQIVSSFSSASAAHTQVTGLSCPVIVPTGRKVKVTTFTPQITQASSPRNGYVIVWDGAVGATAITGATMLNNTAANGSQILAEALVTPTTASKTYNVSIASDGASSLTYGATPTAPAFIKVELA